MRTSFLEVGKNKVMQDAVITLKSEREWRRGQIMQSLIFIFTCRTRQCDLLRYCYYECSLLMKNLRGWQYLIINMNNFHDEIKWEIFTTFHKTRQINWSSWILSAMFELVSKLKLFSFMSNTNKPVIKSGCLMKCIIIYI